jgi:hypothetical protein
MNDVWTGVADMDDLFQDLEDIVSKEVFQEDQEFWAQLATTIARKDIDWEAFLAIKNYCVR